MRVLILDDEPIFADTVAKILKLNGHEARSVYTHDAAIAAAREFHPDVLITGFNNGCAKHGCETAIEVRSFLPDCRTIICSGQPPTADALNQYRALGYEFELLLKPVHPSELLTTLASKEGAG